VFHSTLRAVVVTLDFPEHPRTRTPGESNIKSPSQGVNNSFTPVMVIGYFSLFLGFFEKS
jgi:hypothetical protein